MSQCHRHPAVAYNIDQSRQNDHPMQMRSIGVEPRTVPVALECPAIRGVLAAPGLAV